MKSTILILTVFFLLACKERTNEEDKPYDPQLPPITMVGANTFGCKINGVVMVPRNSIGYVPPGSNHYPCHYSNENNSYKYEAFSAFDLRETKRGGIYLYIQGNPNYLTPVPLGIQNIYNGIVPSNMDFNDFYKNYITFYIYKSDGTQNIYVSIENSGNINVSKSDNIILSGTFSCKAKNINNPIDIIDVTDGRFDINKSNIGITNFP
jgi:hypothetical protein